MIDLKLYEKHNGTRPVEYGFGEEWVAMAMYMNDHPRFYDEDSAVLYWFHSLKDKDILNWYHNEYKEYMEEQHANDKAAEDSDQLNEPSSDPGDETDGPGKEAKGKARKGRDKAKGKESADMGG